jgi:hypothetical protein
MNRLGDTTPVFRFWLLICRGHDVAGRLLTPILVERLRESVLMLLQEAQSSLQASTCRC